MAKTKYKYCAFGGLYYDSKGIVIHESETSYTIIDSGGHESVWSKAFVMVFDTKEERNEWIEKQNYQYDDR